MKRRFLLLFLLATFFAPWTAFGQQLTVYDGTATNNYVPAYIFYFDEFTRSQFVIPAGDLTAMNGKIIYSMTFYTTDYNVPYTTLSSADVYLMEVDYTQISTFEPKANAITVYSGTFDIVSEGDGGALSINFSTPYVYHGGNLLVGIENTVDAGWKNIYFYGQSVSGASVAGYNVNSLDEVQPTQRNFIPKTTFNYITSACTSPINLTTTDITSHSATLNWTGFQDDYDIRYRKKPHFFEDFENGFPSGWTTIDNDGDGYNWFVTTSLSSYCHSGTHVMASESWHRNSNTALTPDNWLVSPQIELQGIMKVWLCARDSYYSDEHFAIYFSTTGNSVSDFSTILVPETIVTGEFLGYTADLSAFAGQLGYIAIRHFNCTNMDQLYLDDFCLIDSPDDDIWEMGWTTSNQLFISNLEPTTEYEWQVRGRNCDSNGTYTDWSDVHDFTTPCETFVVDADHPFFEGFEETTFAPDCWGLFSTGSYSWDRSISYAHSGSASAYSYYYGDNYLVLPNLELQADALTAQITFWSYNRWLSDFVEGNNTVVLLDGNTETVLWSAETVIQAWEETTIDLSDYLGQTVSLAFKYAGNNGNGWYVDDVEVTVSTTATFVTDGNWNNGGCWSIGTVPPAGSDVVIRANAIVPSGYVAVADTVTIDGGSITVADGGQLRHNIFGLEVTMEKNIVGYDELEGKKNYNLLMFPFLDATLPAAMTASSGYDLYKFDYNYADAEWRNDRVLDFTGAHFYDGGYLYASPVDMEISVTGTTFDCKANMDIVAYYTENLSNNFNGWGLFGNPYTCNAYIYRQDSNGELVPMEVMIYDENGDMQTITCGPIAPMQGFFVHVTETTTVSFRDASPNDEHAYVDLGLPSGLLWATCNVGANSPEEYGDYFAWGETSPKDHYDWYNYQHSNGYSLTKYCNNSENGYNGFVDNMTALLTEDDAATANWGSNWRMPSLEEWLELIDNTTQTWTESGCLCQAPNGNSLFLPAAGYYEGTDFFNEGTYGQYWSSSLYSDYAFISYYFFLASDSYFWVANHRCQGRSIRPVRATAPINVINGK